MTTDFETWWLMSKPAECDELKGWFLECWQAALDHIAAPGKAGIGPCQWTPMDSDDMPDTWESACGQAWSFIDGGPAENNCKFCHGCGKPVEVKEQS